MALLIITGVFILLYSILLLYYYSSWQGIPVYTPSGITPAITLSIIIPARNEENNIGPLLNALLAQSYPSSLFEIIVVDDHSTDHTAAIVRKYPAVQLLQLHETGINSYKKKAIQTGIAAATGQLIVTTDADCLPGTNWLSTLADFYTSNKAALIVAPVAFTSNQSVLQVFQSLDFLGLQGITGAAVHNKQLSMCNGANLAYEKKLFEEVGGFSGIDSIASGDDMLLMHKIAKKYPDRVLYLKSKDVIMQTKPMLTWKTFFNQRIRWASKARKYDDKRIISVLALVYLVNLSFPALLIFAAINGGASWLYPLIFLAVKTITELPFICAVASFFDKLKLVRFYFFFQPLHIFYTVYSGLLGQSGSYEWKGRRVK
jgi:poly-beta-1,6-N-acetyl-D-glucosamine synthase